jgi:hypothetical protein
MERTSALLAAGVRTLITEMDTTFMANESDP